MYIGMIEAICYKYVDQRDSNEFTLLSYQQLNCNL